METDRHGGKVVLVTGGGSGIGKATALRFAQEGAERVYVVDHFQERLELVVGQLRSVGTAARGILAELAEVDECDRAVREAFEDAGRLDVVV